MSSDNQRKAWITGASSGLGMSLAMSLAQSGWLVFASARSENELNQLAAVNNNIVGLPCDITDEESVSNVVARIKKEAGRLDRIILNAGSCEYLDFPDPDWTAVRRVMEVNFFGTVNCVKASLPLLSNHEGQNPHLVVVGSQVTSAPFPRAEAYGASKAALAYFCDCLRIDLAPEKIDVTLVNPGFVDTPLTRKNDFEMPFLMDVDEAAHRILRKIESRPESYSFPFRLSLLLSLSTIMPRLWRRMVATKNAPNQASSRGTDL